MKWHLYLYLFLLLSVPGSAQNTLRPVNELIDVQNSAWTDVKSWVGTAKNKVEILPADSTQATDALYKTQVTTRSPMGAIVYHTGGLLIDGGWIRILGSGSAKLTRSLPAWNMGRSYDKLGERPRFLLIADDAAGGFFILNGGLLKDGIGKVFYLSPDNLEYEQMDLSYTEFLNFCFNGNIDKFYSDLRWNGWKDDLAKLPADQVFSFYPFLFTKEGKDLNKDSRTMVPIAEHYGLEMQLRHELGVNK